MKSREKTILKNSLTFTIGNLGSKFLSYILVFVYTYYINASDLGFYDIVLTTIGLLQPIIMLSFDEGIYRWLILATGEEKLKIIASCIKTVGLTSSAAILLFLLINMVFPIQYALLVVLLFATSLMYQLALNAIRGLSNNKLYAFCGILSSFFLLLFEIVGLVVFHMGVEVLFISKILANVLTLIWIYIRQPEFHGILREPSDKNLIRSMMHYTVPLIPNSISWWIVNSSDRYIILLFLGQYFNGIYTVSNKFPTVVNIFSGIVYFALQESIIKEYNAPDRDAFYSKIFEKYYTFLFSLILCGIPLTKLVICYLMGTEYQNAWQFTSLLFLSTVFAALSGFLGIGYQISKETVKSFQTTILSAGLNIILNFLMIRLIGLQAAALSTLLSYVYLFILRNKHTKKYFTLTIRWKKFFMLLAASFAVMVITYFGTLWAPILAFLAALFYFIFSNREILYSVLKKVR